MEEVSAGSVDVQRKPKVQVWSEVERDLVKTGGFFFFLTQGASRDNGDDHLGLESSSTAY